MVDINNMVNNYYNSKNLNFNNLLKLIEGQIDDLAQLSMLNEKASIKVDPGEDMKDINISFPKIRITEDFGKLGTDDRALIEKFTTQIPGDTLEAKLAALNNILTTRKEGATIAEILSTMVTCEILSAIITNFTESAGGFIFEGFLAGLFGGKSIQITTPEQIEGMDATGKPITDVVLGGKHYSLKLLGETTEVKGSFRNMVNHFRTLDHVIYLDARRVDGDQGLQFGEFTITLEGFLDVFVTPFLKTVWRREADRFEDAISFQKKIAELQSANVGIKRISFGRAGFSAEHPNWAVFDFSTGKTRKKEEAVEEILEEGKLLPQDMAELASEIINADPKELQNYANFAVTYAESKFEGTKAEKLFGSYAVVEQLQRKIGVGVKKNKKAILDALELTPGYENEQQFVFTRNQAEDIGNFREVGTLMIGEKYMKNTFAMYADLLTATISPVYEQLQFFTNNVNDYFLGVHDEAAPQDRKQYATAAIENAKALETATNNAVAHIEGDA